MAKKGREYKPGDFIFAKVKGYPAWPARVQKPVQNGKKYFVYFYGTGEIANLPPNMIFDYAENKDKFLSKTVKRKDFNDGVKQIEHDFANNVPLEEVIGVVEAEPADTTANESTANDTTVDESTIADTTVDDTTTEDTTQNETAVEDSDADTGALVIDEGKKGKKPPPKTPAKETPAKKVEPKTPRGRAKKDENKEKDMEEEKAQKDEEIVSRSGRKIRPKRYIDEQTEENTTLPSPAPKKRRGQSPATEKEENAVKEKAEKPSIKQFCTVAQSELEDLKEPFKSEDPDKQNLLITYLPSGTYVGIKLFDSRPNSFKSEASRLQWDKQAASNAITLKMQLEKGHITPQSVSGQLQMELNLTDEEKATLDKEREIEEKKFRVQFLKTEMKLIELDAKIKTCLSLDKADTELCLKLLDELMELELKPLMLLKHPTCVETVKRMRAYVGNAPGWQLQPAQQAQFAKHAAGIRRLADSLYGDMKNLFTTPDGLSFWEFFTERVQQFKKVTASLNADELLELVHEPLEMSIPTSHTMKAAIDAANEEQTTEEETSKKKKAPSTPAKSKKAATNSTPSKPPLKRQSSRRQQQEEKEEKSEEQTEDTKQDEKEPDTKKQKVDEEKQKADTKKKPDDEKQKDTKKQKADEEKDKQKEPEKPKNKRGRKPAEKNEKEEVDKKVEEKSQDDAKENSTENDENESKEDKMDTSEPTVEVSDKKSSDNKDTSKNSDDKVSDSDVKDKNDSGVQDDEGDEKASEKAVENGDVEQDEEPTSQESNNGEANSKDTENDKAAKAQTEKETKSADSKESGKDKKSGKDSAKESGKDSLKESGKDSAKESGKDSAKESGKDRAKESGKDSAKESGKDSEKGSGKEKEKEVEEPRAKRSRESKKTEAPPPRSPAKRKSRS